MCLNNIIEIINASFSYDSSPILQNISIDIQAGDVIGITGPNGAGKSTLLKLMGGILYPQNGDILFEKKSLKQISYRQRAIKIAYVPQESHIPFSFRSIEIVLMGRAPHLPTFGFESKRDLEIAEEAMAMTDCTAFSERGIHTLSGGERQRVLLARALAQEPKILLLDEPTSFLDLRHQVGLHRSLSKLNAQKGTTIIAAIHDLNLAAAFCSRIIMLKDGRIEASGAPSEVITEKIVQDIFDTKVAVGIDNTSGHIYCLPIHC